MHLADGHQGDFGLRAIGAAASVGDLVLNSGEVCGEWHSYCILWVFRRVVDGRACVASRVADWVEYLYDLCVVRAPQIQGSCLVESDPGELGDCAVRVLPAGAGEPARLAGVFAGPVEGDPGGHYADGVWRLLRLLLRRPAALEPRG